MGAARGLPVEKRDTFLQRIAAMLTQRGRGHFNDADGWLVWRNWRSPVWHKPPIRAA